MKKLELNELKLNSFVTSMDDNEKETVHGGSTPICEATLHLGTHIIISVLIPATGSRPISGISKDVICTERYLTQYDCTAYQAQTLGVGEMGPCPDNIYEQ